MRDWNGWTADVATAFLQGPPHERQLCVKLPADALAILGADSECMLLMKSFCGQLDAARRWFLGATRRLQSLRLRQHCMDPCLSMLCESDFPDQPATFADMVGPDRLCGLIRIQWSMVNGQPCMPHWAACFRHSGNLKQFHMYIIICRNVRNQQDLKTINPDPWQLLPTKVGPSGGKNFQGWCPKNFSAVQPFSAHKGSNAKPA